MGSATNRRQAHASLAALLVLASLASTGCTTIGRRVGAPISEPTADLEEGITRVSDVVDLFGPPARLSALPDGLAMLYEYIDATEKQLGINLELIGLDWFKLAFGRGAADRQALLLVFDQDGILQAREYKAWRENIGRGLGFQIFFVAMPTVDSKHLWEAPEQFGWGRQALDPLTVALNAGSSVTSGTHGIEMRGTPDSVGQRTLEAQKKRRRR
ncbi:MAG TPA: hypothetical protein VFG48_09680 [Xanthomonadales bacterium]|nr:hypothetical protein [Xanthomonadales bacterium]